MVGGSATFRFNHALMLPMCFGAVNVKRHNLQGMWANIQSSSSSPTHSSAGARPLTKKKLV